MPHNFLETTLGDTGLNVHRLGLSASYWPGKKTIYNAIDKGINYFFGYGFDNQMISVLRDVFKKERERYIIATGAYNLLVTHQNLRKTVEKRLRQLKTDYIDIFLFLGVTKPGHFPENLREELRELKKTGKVRYVLSNPHVHVCMTAPANIWQFEENIGEVRKGPLNEEELSFVKEYGDLVRHTKKWFM